MSTKINLKYALFFTLVGVSLLAAACASPTTAPNPVVAKPTTAPATPLATAAPALPEATATPMVAPTTPPTAKPVQPTPTAVPTSAETAYNIGTAQTINGVSFFPQKIQYEAAYGSSKPKAGDQFAVITFSIDNTSKTDSFDFDPAKIVVLNTDGTTVPMVTLTGTTGVLAAQKLGPGAKVQGVIVYDVPQNVSKWLLEFEGANSHNLLWSLG